MTLPDPFDPGQAGPEHGSFDLAVAEYISQFHCTIQLDMKTLNQREFYAWCAEFLGAKYKDWFVVESGRLSNKAWSLYLRSAKKATFVRIKFNESIIQSVDIN